MTDDELKKIVASNAQAIAASNDRLARIEAIVEANAIGLNETRAIADSNARAIQANSNAIAELREFIRHSTDQIFKLLEVFAIELERFRAKLDGENN